MKADPREGSQIRAGRAGRRRRAPEPRKIWSQLPLRSRKLLPTARLRVCRGTLIWVDLARSVELLLSFLGGGRDDV